MQYQVKVNNTQKYSDSQGEYIVAPAKFISIGRYAAESVIISETEEIEIGDKVLYANSTYDVIRIDEHNRPIVMLEDEEAQLAIWDKVLALPNQLSEKHIQAIVDGKINDEDKVFVKCIKTLYDEVGFDKKSHIHVNQQNHITLFPAKQSLEEAAEEYYKSDGISNDVKKAFKAGARWAEK